MASGKDTAVARVAKLRYWRAAEARVVVEGWKRSGETLWGFAERHGIRPRRLSRWASRLEEREAAVVQFHPVQLVERRAVAGRSGAAIEIELEGGWRVRVAPGFAAEDLARVLEVLGAGAGC